MLIEIYTRNGCLTCENAKRLLREHNVPFNEYILDQDVSTAKVKEMFPHIQMLPVVLVDGKEVNDVASFKMLLE